MRPGLSTPNGDAVREVVIPDAIRNDAELNAAVEKATEILRSVIRHSGEPPAAEWTLQHDEQHRSCLKLRLSGATAGVEAWFSQEDLGNTDRLKVRLASLWSDLTQLRVDRELQKLHEMIAQMED
jgi:hypothetical protein